MATDFLTITANSRFTSLSTSNLYSPSFSPKLFKVFMSQNQSYWGSINAEIDAHLKQALPLRTPLSVYEPMQHLVFAAPRTMAPALCVATCEITGGERDKALSAASALHLMHAAIFTHEHLLFSNRPTSRSTADNTFSANIKLLTGDGIVPYGYELLARQDDHNIDNSELILRVIIEITRAMGAQGILDGQYRLTQLSEYDNSEELCEHVWKKKEGGFYACGAACGAILGGGSEQEIEKLRRFGLYVGMIHGMMLHHGLGREEKVTSKRVEGFKVLALKELEGFDERKAETISSLLVQVFSTFNV